MWCDVGRGMGRVVWRNMGCGMRSNMGCGMRSNMGCGIGRVSVGVVDGGWV